MDFFVSGQNTGMAGGINSVFKSLRCVREKYATNKKFFY